MDEFILRRAQQLLQRGFEAVASGNFELAREHFRASAHVLKTADALTYWGWMEHQLGNTQLAISLCEQAIEIDPEFGNPYNDIGSYMISLGDLEGAVPWLEKAKKAARYEPRQFPHVNLSRIYLARQMPVHALRELKEALSFAPEDETILGLIHSIEESLN